MRSDVARDADAIDDDDSEAYDENNEEYVKIKDENSNSILFVYQTKWQQRLLNRYGNEMAFLDATYRTMKYALPLFFLVVKTNVDYQIVATFVCENECTETIKEALRIIKEWNPNFSPTYFMTDYSSEEIGAIENLFKGINISTC